MGIRSWLTRPRASTGAGRVVTSEDLAAAIRQAFTSSNSGISVTPDSAMQVAAVYASVRLISGAIANLPVHIHRRIGPDERQTLDDHPAATVLRRAPNDWQIPQQFKRTATAHLLLRGAAYARIVRSQGRVVALLPLHPDRVRVEQRTDGRLLFHYSRPDGVQAVLQQQDVFYLVGLSLDGVNGVSVLTYARESIGLSLAQERDGAQAFRNAIKPSVVLKHPAVLGTEGRQNLQDSLNEYRNGGDKEGKALILEEGLEVSTLSMTAEDAQWIESRKFSRSDIAMFFGVPPHMIGDTEKSTSWGSGIEQQSIGFVTYTLEDYLTAWEETINRDLIPEPDVYAKFNRSALIRGDIKTRLGWYTGMVGAGLMSPNEARALEDMNPRPDGLGDTFRDPAAPAATPTQGADDVDPPAARA